MTLQSIMEHQRAWGALAALVGLIVLGLGGLGLLSSMRDVRATEIETMQTELDVLERRIARPATPAQAQQRLTVNPFINADSFALAANALQRRVVSVIESSGGTLATVGIDPQDTSGDARNKVVVQAAAEMTNDSLQQVLYKLEGEAPFVFIEGLTANPVNNRDASEGDQSKSEPPRLTVTLRLNGYFRGASK